MHQSLLKSACIRSYSGPHFSRNLPYSDWIRRDTSISLYLVGMRENAGKMRTRITPNTDTFYAVNIPLQSVKVDIKRTQTKSKTVWKRKIIFAFMNVKGFRVVFLQLRSIYNYLQNKEFKLGKFRVGWVTGNRGTVFGLKQRYCNFEAKF